jgi:RNA polymerase sigma factor (sigma-70 family)
MSNRKSSVLISIVEGNRQHAPRLNAEAWLIFLLVMYEQFYAKFVHRIDGGCDAGAKVTDSNHAVRYSELFFDIDYASAQPLKYPPGYGRDPKLGRIARKIANRTREPYRDMRRVGKVLCRNDTHDAALAIEIKRADLKLLKLADDWRRGYAILFCALVPQPAWIVVGTISLLFPRSATALHLGSSRVLKEFLEKHPDTVWRQRYQRPRQRLPQYAVAWIGRKVGKKLTITLEPSAIRDSEILPQDAIYRSRENDRRRKPAQPDFRIADGEDLLLVELARSGNKPAQDRLMLGFWRFARTIAKPFAVAFSIDELATQALLGTRSKNGDPPTNGLLYAVANFDANAGRSFKNCAAEAMRWAIQEFLRQNPTHNSLSADRYNDDDGRPITWLDSVIDVGPDPNAEANDRRLESIMAAVGGLDPQAQKIFLARHSFADQRPTLQELGEQFGCSHETIRRILKGAEAEVREKCEKSRPENY